MRIDVRTLEPFPLTWAVAAAPGVPERELARVAAAAALRVHSGDAGDACRSHRDGLGAAVVGARGTRVGIDLERAGAVPPELERFFATAAERRALGAPRDAAVLWALKEAAWKAFHCPSDLPFTALELGVDRAADLTTVRIDGRVHTARSRVLRLAPRWIVALVWAEEGA